MRAWMVGLATAVVIVLGLAIAAIVAVTASGGTTALVDLEPGTCFDLPESVDVGSIEEVTTIDCDEPHEAEVVDVGQLGSDGRDYPPDDELFAEVDERCRPVELVDSDRFGLLPIAPTETLWQSFDGRYLCVAIPFGGGSVAGSALAG